MNGGKDDDDFDFTQKEKGRQEEKCEDVRKSTQGSQKRREKKTK